MGSGESALSWAVCYPAPTRWSLPRFRATSHAPVISNTAPGFVFTHYRAFNLFWEPMPEDRKKSPSDPNGTDLDRRQFVKVGATSLGVAGLGAGVFGLRYLSPNVLYEPSPIVSVGRPERYTVGSVTLDPRFGIFVVRAAEGFYALSAVCTHLGCLSTWKPDAGVIACPCHGSTFQRDGTTIAGPAPAPLPWLKVWLGDDGFLMVDRSITVPPHSEYVQVEAHG